MTDNMFDPDRQAAHKAEAADFARAAPGYYTRVTCGLPDPTNHGTCRMNPKHHGMHVGPVSGQHESWHGQETT
jgi:hypothetical protein